MNFLMGIVSVGYFSYKSHSSSSIMINVFDLALKESKFKLIDDIQGTGMGNCL